MIMKILQIDLNGDCTDALKEAVFVLERGGVIIYPTDTLYGIGGNALDKKAISRILEIKERPISKPLSIIVRNIRWAKGLAYISKRQEEILERIWPGKVTAVLSKREIVPDVLTGGYKTVGIRIPDSSLTDQLLKLFGYPLVSTSANLSGREPTQDINKIIDIFSKKLTRQPDLVLDAGVLPKSEPSTVLDLTTNKPKILRVGPSKPKEFLRLLNI